MVSYGAHEDLEILGYFSSIEKAKEYMNAYNDSKIIKIWGWNEIQEWGLDCPRYNDFSR